MFAHQTLAADANYEVTWNKQAQTLAVEVCLPGKPSLLLSNHDRELSTALVSARQASNDGQYQKQVIKPRNRIQFDTGLSDCLHYQISLKPQSRYPYVMEQNSLVMPTHLWLWRHQSIKNASFRFKDSQGETLRFYLPFPQQDNGWDLSLTPPGWTSRTMVGDVQHYPVALRHKKQINAVLLGSLNNNSKRWLEWLQETASAVETAFGYFPIQSANILVIPSTSRRSPVPWGEVQRGGYPAVHFFIDPNKSQEKFQEDWTASHEMSHLFVPKTSWRDRWLSEGIASYYQNVLRARGGIISTELAWQKLRQGFARGRGDFNQRSLRNVNKTMHLYWGGVAIYLLADLRLREQGSSLEAILEGFNKCCFKLDKTWSAEELMAQFDALSNTSIFSDLLENEASAKQFPVSAAFESKDPLITRHLANILQGK